MELTLSQLKIDKAKQEEWDSILEILNETNLFIYFSGNESYKTFYVVKEPTTFLIIACFSIDYDKEVGILKSFAIRNQYQGKGIGKAIIKQMLKLAQRLKLRRIYFHSIEKPLGFWKKTVFKNINEKEINDKYFLNYIHHLETTYPNDYDNNRLFYLEIA